MQSLSLILKIEREKNWMIRNEERKRERKSMNGEKERDIVV